MLAMEHRGDSLVRNVRQSIALLSKGVEIQRALLHAPPDECPMMLEETSVCQVLDKVRQIYATPPAAVGRTLRVVNPPDVAIRVFQRYFTTPIGYGRGLDTFTMKWLTEKYLKGKVDFTSTEADGTTFRLWLPERL
jgi:hypothetical protein